MSDLEQFKKMLLSTDTEIEEREEPLVLQAGDLPLDCICIEVRGTRVNKRSLLGFQFACDKMGYSGFVSCWYFTKEGKFLATGAWE